MTLVLFLKDRRAVILKTVTTDIRDVLLDLALHGYIEHCPELEFGSLEVAHQRNREAEQLSPQFWAFMCTRRAELRVAQARWKLA